MIHCTPRETPRKKVVSKLINVDEEGRQLLCFGLWPFIWAAFFILGVSTFFYGIFIALPILVLLPHLMENRFRHWHGGVKGSYYAYFAPYIIIILVTTKQIKSPDVLKFSADLLAIYATYINFRILYETGVIVREINQSGGRLGNRKGKLLGGVFLHSMIFIILIWRFWSWR